MTKWLSLLVVLALTGCGTLVPKRVEFFQDKVEPFPEQTAYAKELQRQLVQRLEQKTGEVVVAAVEEKASTNVVAPAKESHRLAVAEAVFVGPPVKPAPETVSSPVLAAKMETAVAKLDRKVEEFKKDNNENVGKKIEGTGLVSIPYFYWVGGILLVVVIVFFIGKLLLSAAAAANPGAAIGLNVVNAATSVISKGFSQLVKGGEDFKTWVEKEVQDAGLKQKILDAFQSTHMKAQDKDVQDTVRAVTK